MECDDCGKPIEPPSRPHIFESTSGKRLSQVCDDCCPRCWSGLREAPLK